MSAIQEQFSTATKAQFDAQLSFFSMFASKAFESVEKLVELNMTALKSSMEESNNNAQQLIAAKDPQEFFALYSTQAKPSAEKALGYSRHVASIASSAHAEFARITEEQIADTSRKVSALVDDVSKNAPAGSENMVSMVQSAISSANAGYEQINKSTKEAVQTIEANVSTATEQFAQAADKVTARTKI